MTRSASSHDFHHNHFVPVSKERFFAIVGAMNVNPLVVLATLKDRVHVSHWETPRREVVGRSAKDSWSVMDSTYSLAPEYAA